VLSAIGTTVAIGALLSMVFAAILTRAGFSSQQRKLRDAE